MLPLLLLVGRVHDENRSPPGPRPPWDDDDAVMDEVPPSPPSALSLVMTSRKDGRTDGS